MAFVTPFAPTTAELNSCVECGLCLPTCPTFRLTGKEAASPRGRLTAMAAVAAGIATVDGTFEEIMGFCLQCRACETACPSLVPFGRAMEGARVEVTAQRSSLRRRLRHRLLGPKGLGSARFVRVVSAAAWVGQRLGGRRWLPGRLGKSLRGFRRLRLRAKISYPETAALPLGKTAVLTGCVMEPWFPGVNEATATVLRRAGYDVVAPDEQTCCGALAAHDGAAAQARELAAQNDAAFADFDLVVANAAGCSAHLKEYGNWLPEDDVSAAGWESRARDITEVVAAAIASGALPTLAATGASVAVQDPCHLRHAQKITAAPRAILVAAGLQPVEIDEDGTCCGAAGIYSLFRPKASGQLGTEKAAQVVDSGAVVVASANPGCEMQLRAYLDIGYRIAHPVELYAEALQAAGEL